MDALLNLPSYILALLLLLVAVLAISIMVFFQKWKTSRDSQAQETNPWSREQDLRQYGITEIRPIAPRQQTYEYEYPTSFESPEYSNVDQDSEQTVFEDDDFSFSDPSHEPESFPQAEPAVYGGPVNEPAHREQTPAETGVNPAEVAGIKSEFASEMEDLGIPDDEGIVGVREVSPSTEERLLNIKETAPRNRSLDSILRPAVKFAQASLACQTVCTLAFRDDAFVVTSGTSETDKLQQHNRVLRHQSFIRYVDYAEPFTILPADVYQLKSDELGYYRGDVTFSEVAAAPIYADGQFWGFLVADSAEVAAFSNPRAQRILTDSARLLGESLSEKKTGASVDEVGNQTDQKPKSTSSPDDPDIELTVVDNTGDTSDISPVSSESVQGSTEESTSDEERPVRIENVSQEKAENGQTGAESVGQKSHPRESETKRVKLRREVIYEELLQAREDQAPLAFLLVCLNDTSHEYLPDGSDFSAVETQLKQLIESTLEGKSRTERFGKLMMGVFLFAPLPAAETWMETIQEKITTEINIPPSGISIGATLTGSRHKDGNSVLQEAIDALKDVYADGGATIYV